MYTVIVVREVTATSASEHKFPALELRVRDPVTGVVFTDKARNNRDLYKNTVPVKFDIKGNYGVAINWSDGHYADIFPFDTLRKIAAEVSSNRSNSSSR